MTKIADFPLKLHKTIFTKMNFEAISDFTHSENSLIELMPINKLSVNDSPEDPRILLVQMNTVVNPDKAKQSPYFIELICLAVFEYPESMNADEARRAVTITGHHVCYGAIRECVSWMTGRLPYGSVNLGLSILNLGN